jgi:O-antigen/teichoic acid export membrane protein
VTLAGIAVLIIEQTDKLVIGASLPIEQVTLYSAAWKLYVLAYNVPTILMQALSPVLAHLHGAGETGRLRLSFFRMTKYSGALALPLAASLALSSGWILKVWMGPSFAHLYTVVAVLVCGFAVTSLNHAGHSVLLATNQVRRRLWVYDAPQAVVNLALSVWLVRPLGILGVALGTLIPSLLMQYGFLRLLSSTIGVTWIEWRRVVAATVIPCVVAFTPTLIVRFTAGPFSPVVFVGSILSSAAFLVWFWHRGLDDDERAWLRARVPVLSNVAPAPATDLARRSN